MRVYFGQQGSNYTGPLQDGVGVRQSFRAEDGRLTSISVFFTTYQRENPGEIVLDLVDQRGTVIATAKADSGGLVDNDYREFGFGVDLELGKMYELRLHGKNCRAGMSPAAACGMKTGVGHLFVGARLVRGSELTCVFEYAKKEALACSGRPLEFSMEEVEDTSIPGLVSVVIPHYNAVGYLPETLASIAAQSYSCHEVIVVDDGSECWKEAERVVNAWKPAFNRLEFVRMEKNGGAPAARNEGVRHSAGEYLFFCDSDVTLYPRAFELLVGCLVDNQDAEFSYGGFYWDNFVVSPKEFDADGLRRGNYVTTMSMVRRRAFPGWDESLARLQDWDLWLTVVERGGSGVCCGRYLFKTPQRKDGISSGKKVSAKEAQDIVIAKHGLRR